jgi:aspartyl-tRNA(Asn)/glutamyl-tRNA(Gln) amidotransferase subunit C
MAITLAEVEELALLARLRLTAEEAERLRGELSSILGYVAKLEALDTGGVEPMTHAVPMDCPLRDDAVAPSLTVEEALAAAPATQDDCFVVPKIIEAKS